MGQGTPHDISHSLGSGRIQKDGKAKTPPEMGAKYRHREMRGYPRAIRRKLGSRRLKAVINPHYPLGMSTSIRRGLAEVNPTCEAVLIALADQPLIEKDLIDRLIDAYRENPHGIVLPSYRGERGHPVIVSRLRYQEAMENLTGDRGCKPILNLHPGDILEVEVESEAVVADIDSWEEYRSTGVHGRGFQDDNAR